MIIRARAPLRISFAGGGTDVPPYCDEREGAVLAATINRYACTTLIPGRDKVNLKSLDYDVSVTYDLADPFVFDGQLDLAKGVLRHFRQENGLFNGLEVYLHNDAPPGSGLGSSSAITVSLITAFKEYFRESFDPYEVADLAYRIERVDVGIVGGKQDQYMASFGGFNFIEFTRDVTAVNPLRIRPETLCELEYSLLFAYVGGQHFSAHIIEKQVQNYRNGVAESVAALDAQKQAAYDMKNALLTGRLGDFGELLDWAWACKKKMAEGITNPRIDEIYEEAKRAGALGGKISGAGGGGFMFFFCDPRCRFAVQEALKRLGAQLVQFSFVKDGAQAWVVG